MIRCDCTWTVDDRRHTPTCRLVKAGLIPRPQPAASPNCPRCGHEWDGRKREGSTCFVCQRED